MPQEQGRIAGRATAAGTKRFAERARRRAGARPDHFRRPDALWLSSIALGTRQGRPGGEDDARYRDAVADGLALGCNVFDTAISDRMQTSERAVGAALRDAVYQDGVARDEFAIITKGGTLTPDPDHIAAPGDARRDLLRSYIDTGLVEAERLVGGNSLSPAFHVDQIERSRRNLGLETLDFYLVQEPELHLGSAEPSEFRNWLIELFEALEEEARRGHIGAYGIASWDGLLLPYSERRHLSLVEVFDAALEAGSGDHHLRAVQLPYGLANAEAAALNAQLAPDAAARGLFDMLRDTGTLVLASAPLYGGRVLRAVPDFVRDAYPEAMSAAQCCLQFVRSTAGVHCAVAGMRDPAHLRDNLALARVPAADPEIAARLLAEAGRESEAKPG